ncbi:SMC-Scp complex subunit ScpB [Arenimonas sp.]|nr:SMC-Scp complex subunit ScpB [Candidatus Parcubacteria bacterium]
MNKIAQKIEAYLFFQGEPVTIKNLTKTLDTDTETIEQGLLILSEKVHTDSGIVLIRYDDMVTLGTHIDVNDFIEKKIKEDLQKELGKSALETLAIILYQCPIKRADIDYVRGVNSQFILRNLLIRGLITRVDDPSDERTFLYRPSLELLAFLGITDITQLPEYEEVLAKLSSFKTETKE